ncbi:MAG: hypothetical protein JKY34_16300 [Kordiimonadaceae bacterium]|nr:hypothetical protein [Kordiimonadaceae bacterium]
MADVILNWVGEFTTTVGTGDFILGGSLGGGMGTFAAALASGDLADGDAVFYSYQEGDSSEIGLAVYDDAAGKLLRPATVEATVNGARQTTPVECYGAGKIVGSSQAQADQLLTQASSPTFEGLDLTAAGDVSLSLDNTLFGHSATLIADATGVKLTAGVGTDLGLGGGGVESLVLDASGDATFSGNVGVSGATVSDYPFNDLVVGGGDSVVGFTLATTGAAQQATISFADGTATAAERNAGYIQYQHNIDSMTLSTANTLALTLDSSQNAAFSGDVNVGGTPTGTARATLDLVGWRTDADVGVLSELTTENAQGAVDAASIQVWGTGSPDEGQMRFYTNNGSVLTQALQIDSSQNATFSGTINLSNNKSINWLDSSSVLRTGIRWGTDNSLNFSSGQANAIGLVLDASSNATFSGDVTVGGNVLSSSSATSVVIGADTTAATGASLKMYPSGHASAGDWAFRHNNVNNLVYDDSVSRFSFTGAAYVTGKLTVDGGAKITMGSPSGGVQNGLFWSTAVDTNWGTYFGLSGANKSLANGTACTSLDGRSGSHIRNRVHNGTVGGFLWENHSEQCLMSLTADTGDLYTLGDVNVGGDIITTGIYEASGAGRVVVLRPDHPTFGAAIGTTVGYGFAIYTDETLALSFSGTDQSADFQGNDVTGISALTISNEIQLPQGSVGDPSLSFESYSNSGIYMISTTAMGVAIGGSLQLSISDATVDLQGNDMTTTGTVTAGKVSLGSPTELTLNAGAVTVSKSFHMIDTEADAATDDLVTITGGDEGDIMVVVAASDSRTVVLKDSGGNLVIAGDCSLDTAHDSITLIKGPFGWHEMCRSNNA